MRNYQNLDIFETTKRMKDIANQIKLTELMCPTSADIDLIAELKYRIEKLEIIPLDMGTTTFNG